MQFTAPGPVYSIIISLIVARIALASIQYTPIVPLAGGQSEHKAGDDLDQDSTVISIGDATSHVATKVSELQRALGGHRIDESRELLRALNAHLSTADDLSTEEASECMEVLHPHCYLDAGKPARFCFSTKACRMFEDTSLFGRYHPKGKHDKFSKLLSRHERMLWIKSASGSATGSSRERKAPEKPGSHIGDIYEKIFDRRLLRPELLKLALVCWRARSAAYRIIYRLIEQDRELVLAFVYDEALYPTCRLRLLSDAVNGRGLLCKADEPRRQDVMRRLSGWKSIFWPRPKEFAHASLISADTYAALAAVKKMDIIDPAYRRHIKRVRTRSRLLVSIICTGFLIAIIATGFTEALAMLLDLIILIVTSGLKSSLALKIFAFTGIGIASLGMGIYLLLMILLICAKSLHV